MYKYTTPTHVFKFSEDTDDFEKLIVSYSQKGEVVLEKNKTDFSFSEQGEYWYASVTLTQAETALFDASYPCCIQVKVKDSDGVVRVSSVEHIDIDSVLHEEEI